MDAITLLKNDHQTVERLFGRYEATSDNAEKTRRDLLDDMIHELSVHAAIEEQVFYPAVRLAVPEAEDEVLEGLEEHHIVKWTLSELQSLGASDERFNAKVTVLIEAVRHHVEEEEGEMFPKVARALNAGQLEDLGHRLDAAKSGAPTRPHPRSPDAPPGNLVVGAVAGVVDKAREVGREAIESARDAIGEARDAGEDAVQDARRSAKRGARSTSRKASATKRSVTKKASSAKKSASRTAKQASRSAKTTANKATKTAKKSARKATKTAKKSARSAAGTAKKSTGSAKATAKKSTKKKAATKRSAR